MACCSALLYLMSWFVRLRDPDPGAAGTTPSTGRKAWVFAAAAVEIGIAWLIALTFGDGLTGGHRHGAPMASHDDMGMHHGMGTSAEQAGWLPDSWALLAAIGTAIVLLCVSGAFSPRKIPWVALALGSVSTVVLMAPRAREFDSHLWFMLGIEMFSVVVPLTFALTVSASSRIGSKTAAWMLIVGAIGSASFLWLWHVGTFASMASGPSAVAQAVSLTLCGALFWTGAVHAPRKLWLLRAASLVVMMQASALLAFALMFVPASSAAGRWDLVLSGVLMLVTDAIGLLVVSRHSRSGADTFVAGAAQGMSRERRTVDSARP